MSSAFGFNLRPPFLPPSLTPFLTSSDPIEVAIDDHHGHARALNLLHINIFLNIKAWGDDHLWKWTERRREKGREFRGNKCTLQSKICHTLTKLAFPPPPTLHYDVPATRRLPPWASSWRIRSPLSENSRLPNAHSRASPPCHQGKLPTALILWG